MTTVFPDDFFDEEEYLKKERVKNMSLEKCFYRPPRLGDIKFTGYEKRFKGKIKRDYIQKSLRDSIQKVFHEYFDEVNTEKTKKQEEEIVKKAICRWFSLEEKDVVVEKVNNTFKCTILMSYMQFIFKIPKEEVE